MPSQLPILGHEGMYVGLLSQSASLIDDNAEWLMKQDKVPPTKKAVGGPALGLQAVKAAASARTYYYRNALMQPVEKIYLIPNGRMNVMSLKLRIYRRLLTATCTFRCYYAICQGV